MKSLKKLTVGALAFALVGVAYADTYNFTGSSAYRKPALQSIEHFLDAGYKVGYSNGDADQYGAGSQIYVGTYDATNFGGTTNTPVTIKCTWTGSEGGLYAVGTPLLVDFIPSSVDLTNSPVKNIADPTKEAAGTFSKEYAQVAMCDTAKASSSFKAASANLTASVPLNLGICPFKWIVSAGAPAAFTNITSAQIKQLYSAGTLKASFFTGNATDSHTVNAIGRDPDSGTRLTAFAESGVGALATVTQKEPCILSGTAMATDAAQTITSFRTWPTSAIYDVTVNLGNGGYASGATLAAAMQCAVAATGTNVMVAYASTGDAGKAITGGCKELSYNGVTLGTMSDYNLATNLISGNYAFWSIEHMYYNTPANTANSNIKKFADAVASYLQLNKATVKITSMKVKRTGDIGTNILAGSIPTN